MRAVADSPQPSVLAGAAHGSVASTRNVSDDARLAQTAANLAKKLEKVVCKEAFGRSRADYHHRILAVLVGASRVEVEIEEVVVVHAFGDHDKGPQISRHDHVVHDDHICPEI